MLNNKPIFHSLLLALQLLLLLCLVSRSSSSMKQSFCLRTAEAALSNFFYSNCYRRSTKHASKALPYLKEEARKHAKHTMVLQIEALLLCLLLLQLLLKSTKHARFFSASRLCYSSFWESTEAWEAGICRTCSPSALCCVAAAAAKLKRKKEKSKEQTLNLLLQSSTNAAAEE